MSAPRERDEWVAFDARLRRYVTRRLGSGADVDDVVQEILARVHTGLPTLRDRDRFIGWTYRIATHIVVDRLRARARDPLRVPLESLETINAATAADLTDDASELQSDLARCIVHFVARLAPPYRDALALTELAGLPHKDAARQLGISLPAVKARVLRGRGKLRDMFDECCRISTDCRGRVVECESRPLEQVPDDCRAAAADWSARRQA